MMDAFGTWLRDVVLSALTVSVLSALVTEESFRKPAQLAGGLIFILVALRPLSGMKLESPKTDLAAYRADIEIQCAAFEEENRSVFSQSIAEGTAAYIMDKAAALGLTVAAEVTVSADENGTFLPAEVMLRGSRSDELSQWIRETLGIPEEKQYWSDE